MFCPGWRLVPSLEFLAKEGSKEGRKDGNRRPPPAGVPVERLSTALEISSQWLIGPYVVMLRVIGGVVVATALVVIFLNLRPWLRRVQQRFKETRSAGAAAAGLVGLGRATSLLLVLVLSIAAAVVSLNYWLVFVQRPWFNTAAESETRRTIDVYPASYWAASLRQRFRTPPAVPVATRADHPPSLTPTALEPLRSQVDGLELLYGSAPVLFMTPQGPVSGLAVTAGYFAAEKLDVLGNVPHASHELLVSERFLTTYASHVSQVLQVSQVSGVSQVSRVSQTLYATQSQAAGDAGDGGDGGYGGYGGLGPALGASASAGGSPSLSPSPSSRSSSSPSPSPSPSLSPSSQASPAAQSPLRLEDWIGRPLPLPIQPVGLGQAGGSSAGPSGVGAPVAGSAGGSGPGGSAPVAPTQPYQISGVVRAPRSSALPTPSPNIYVLAPDLTRLAVVQGVAQTRADPVRVAADLGRVLNLQYGDNVWGTEAWLTQMGNFLRAQTRVGRANRLVGLMSLILTGVTVLALAQMNEIRRFRRYALERALGRSRWSLARERLSFYARSGLIGGVLGAGAGQLLTPHLVNTSSLFVNAGDVGTASAAQQPSLAAFSVGVAAVTLVAVLGSLVPLWRGLHVRIADYVRTPDEAGAGDIAPGFAGSTTPGSAAASGASLRPNVGPGRGSSHDSNPAPSFARSFPHSLTHSFVHSLAQIPGRALARLALSPVLPSPLATDSAAAWAVVQYGLGIGLLIASVSTY